MKTEYCAQNTHADLFRREMPEGPTNTRKGAQYRHPQGKTMLNDGGAPGSPNSGEDLQYGSRLWSFVARPPSLQPALARDPAVPLWVPPKRNE